MRTVKVSGVIAAGAMCLSLLPVVSSADAAGKPVLKPLGTTNGDCSELASVTSLSPTDVWAVGGDGCGTPNAEIQHWDGKRVSRVHVADASGGYEEYFGVAARSPSDIWAVGGDSSNTSTFALIARWNGKKWALQPPPPGYNDTYFGDVRVASNGDVWLAGELGFRATLLRVRGTTRKVFRLPHAGRQLNGLYLASPTSMWAGGDGYLVHGDGMHWRTTQALEKVDIRRLDGSSSSDIWAVGDAGTTSALLHYDGRNWRRVNSIAVPQPVFLTGLSVHGARDVWVTGSVADGALTRPLVVHWNGKTWSRVTVTMPAATPNGIANGITITKRGIFAVGKVWDNTLDTTIEGPQWWSTIG